MGSVWGLAVRLLFLCWKAEVAANSAGLNICTSAFLVTTSGSDRPRSEGAFRTTELTQDVPLDSQTQNTKTASYTLMATSSSSEINSRDTQTISPGTETGKTHTTPPTVSALDIHTTSPAASAMDSHTTLPTVPALDIHTTSPTTSALDIQITLPTVSTLDIQTTSPAASTLDIPTTLAASTLDTPTIPPTVSTLDIHTTSPATSTLDIHTTSPATSALDIQTIPPTVSTLDIHTTSPAASTLDTQTTFPTTEALKTQTISSVTETRTLALRIPADFMVVSPIPTDASATSGSPRTGMSTVKAGTVSGALEAIVDTLCTDDSSEEARKITIDLLTLAHTSTETEHQSSVSSSSSDSSSGVLTSSRVLKPNIATPAKDLVALSITHIKLTTCITEIETSVIISETSRTNNSPTGATALSTSETVTLPQSPEAKSLSPKTTSSPGTLSTAHTSALATSLVGTLPISDVTGKETTVSQSPISSGTWVTVSTNPLRETSTLSVETQSHTEVLGTITVPRAAGSTVGKAISAGSSTSANSPSVAATTKSAPASETLSTRDITSSSFLRGSHVPFVCPTTDSISKIPNITLAATSPKTPTKPPTSTPTATWTKTKHDPGEGRGFLLVRLSITSPEDLTEPRATEKLMNQLSCELHTHMPLVRVSLLNVRRG